MARAVDIVVPIACRPVPIGKSDRLDEGARLATRRG